MTESKQILIVEDELDLCESIEATLRRAGFKSHGVSDFRKAIGNLKNQTYDLILLDLKLGHEMGEDLITFARAPKSLNLHTPIVLISGNIQEDIIKRNAKQIQGALVKPINRDTLLAAVRKHLI